MATLLDAASAPSVAPHVASGPAPAVLASLHDPAVNLAVWARTLDDRLLAELASLDLCCAQDLRLTATPDELATALPPAMAAAGWQAPALTEDMVMLARRFAGVMACTSVDLRLDLVRGDACRKFHADFVPARLVTTYLGPGTDWLPDGAADEAAARRLAAGAVGLFKGRTWPTQTPIIHRSPPIAGTGQVRVVLVINPRNAGTGC